LLQIAIGTDDVYKTAEAIKLSGGKITREPGPLPGISTKITACLDPDGWKAVWLVQIFLFSCSRPGNLCFQQHFAYITAFCIYNSILCFHACVWQIFVFNSFLHI
jgi:hypothetical protein